MADQNGFEITEPKTEEEFEQYYQLRYERLRKPLGLPRGSERDDAVESASTHMIVKMDGRVVAAGSYAVGMRVDEVTGKRGMFVRFRQVAVDPAYEGRGIGKMMTKYVEAKAREIGAFEVIGNVRQENVPYWTRMGYETTGEGQTVVGLEHVQMGLRLI